MHLRASFSPLLSCVAALLFPLLVCAQEEPYYTWVDENGVTNFSQKNPKDVDAVFVSRETRFGQTTVPTAATTPSRRPGKLVEPEAPAPQPASGASAEAAPAGAAEPANEQLDEQMASERAAVDAEIAKARQTNCNAGKRNLARLEAYARIRVREADGSERTLSDDEKAQRIAGAKELISQNCGPAG